MRPPRMALDHFAFPSFDAQSTHRFYTGVLGFRLLWAADGTSREWGGRSYLMMAFSFGTGEVHFFALDGAAPPAPDGLPKDIRHLALTVGSRATVAAWERRLRAHRVRYWREVHDGRPSLYFSDPNGLVLELTAAESVAPAPAARAARRLIRRWSARHRRPSGRAASPKRGHA